jgi:hypothetical protein
MLGAAEKIALGCEALAARQMHAAPGALDHVFAACGGRFRLAPINAAAVALEYPVDGEQSEDEKNDFRQAALRGPVG